MDRELVICSLHDHPELIANCCKLLNEEWPRSEVARLRSIENSNPNLPVSLLLVNKKGNNSNNEVIGHAKISRLPNDHQSCWVESVVISPAYRGKGYGRIIMESCEQFARNLHFSTICLSTHDKEEFYKKLGFDLCEPICHFGSKTKISIYKLSDSSSVSNKLIVATEHHRDRFISGEVHRGATTKISCSIPPPPPPPTYDPKISMRINGTKVYMKKVL